MNKRIFFTQLVAISGVAMVALYFLHQQPGFQLFSKFSSLSLALFIAISIVMYLTGQPAALSTNKNLFSRVVLLFIFIKMLFAVGLVAGYHHFVQPLNRRALLPFFLIYLVFTVFETYFMAKLGRMESKP